MKTRDLILGVIVTLIWGSNFSVIEVGLRDLDPFLLTAFRFAFTAFPLMLFLRRPRDVPTAALASYGVMFGVGLWWVVNLAMSKGMSPGLSSLLLQFSAFFTVILGALFLREPIRIAHRVSMIVAAAGLLLVINSTTGTSSALGVGLVLLAALSWSACNLLVKTHKPRDMMAFVVWSSAFAAPALFLLTFLSEGTAPFVTLVHGVTWRAVGSVLFQAYVTTVFGYMVWNNLMRTYPAATVAPLSLMVPVSGIVTSFLVFDEAFPVSVWIGVAVILLGVALFVSAPYLERRFVGA